MTPGRIIPDSAIVEAANALPRDRASLLGLKGFRGRGAERYAAQWLEALRIARELPDSELPPLAARYDGPPPPRAWADRDPVAAARLSAARGALATLSEQLDVPVENLLTPDFVRRLLWEPPEPEPGAPRAELEKRLRGRGSDSEEAIARRLAESAVEMSHWQEFDYVIVNRDFEAAVAELEAIFDGHGEASRRDRPELAALARELLGT